MALASNKWGTGDAVTKAAVDTQGFVPEVWSDEIVAAYKKSLVAANLFKKMNFKGKKGDKVYFPAPARGVASAKAVETLVTLQGASGTAIGVNIDQHYEYSRLIEDLAEVQASSSMRRFYTDDAGYALATNIDTALIRLGRGAQGGTAGSAAYDKAYLGGDGSTLYVDGSNLGTALTDEGFRRAIQRLDDADVPMDARYFIIPPATRNTMMGLARFTEQAFVGDASGSNTIRNGQIGDVYGVKVYVTTNADTATTNTTRIALLFHPEAAVLVEQLGIRVQTQYKQEYLSTLLTADTLYGVGELRDTSMVALAVPA
jgi:N4-gp56 family major capsid protein